MVREYIVVDTDIHPIPSMERVLDFLPEPWRMRAAGGNQGPGSIGYWNPIGVMRADAVTPNGTRIETDPNALSKYFFDACNIDYGILNFPVLTIALSPEPDYSASLLSAINDVIVEDWLPVDSRFRTSLVVTLSDPQLAVQEIHRLGDHPGIAQVLMPGGSPLPLGHRYFHPIYAAAVEHDLPVAVHPGAEGAGISGPPGAAGHPSSYLEWHTGLSVYYQSQLLSLVTEGVFTKFPTLKFVLIEGGASWLPPLLWRLDKNWKALRMTAPWLDRPPSEVVQEHVLMTTQPLEEPPRSEYFRQILEMFDAEHMLMFSSDFPHWDGDTPDFAARAIPEKMRARVMGENARELYKLPEQNMAKNKVYQVAKTDEIAPGERKIVDIDGRSVGVFNVNGKFVAVLNLCPHELAPVCLGQVRGTTLPSEPGEYKWGKEDEILACPWHGWEFDLLSGECLVDRRKLHFYHVEVKDDVVFVEI